MRTAFDRIRHAVSFELIGLALVTPLGAWAFDMPMSDMGVVTVVSATIATIWNYLFNLGFDHLLLRVKGSVRKTLPMRVAHAILFEVGLLAVLMPFIAWYLGVSLLHALLMDASFALFYMVYAFAFNWGYDVVYPVQESRAKAWTEPATSSTDRV
ncbi:PACE efflux transporter [Aminobacter sp. BA135]|uniref:PACE efflux transporter n=1 Tax=Aminobacter sp. BA135 TaxID=537596 RepID=UPI003D790096